MAFTLIDGFDLYNGVASTTIGVYGTWQNVSTGGSISIVSGRFAGQGLQFTDGTGNTSAIRRSLPAAQTEFSVGFAFRHMNHSNIGGGVMMHIMNSSAQVELTMYLNGSNGTIRLYRGAGVTHLFDSPVATMAEAVWQHVELVGTLDQTGGTLELFIDGISKGSYTGDTAQTAIANFQFIQIGAPDGSGSGNAAQFDDVYVTNTAQRVGEMRIDAMRVNSDSLEQDWSPTPSGAAYQTLDDNTVNIADYIQADTVGDTSYFGVQDLSVTPESIKAVQITSWGLKTDAGTRQFALLSRIGADEQVGATNTLAASPQKFTSIFETTPTGGDWDATAINNLEIGVRVIT